MRVMFVLCGATCCVSNSGFCGMIVGRCTMGVLFMYIDISSIFWWAMHITLFYHYVDMLWTLTDNNFNQLNPYMRTSIKS